MEIFSDGLVAYGLCELIVHSTNDNEAMKALTIHFVQKKLIVIILSIRM